MESRVPKFVGRVSRSNKSNRRSPRIVVYREQTADVAVHRIKKKLPRKIAKFFAGKASSEERRTPRRPKSIFAPLCRAPRRGSSERKFLLPRYNANDALYRPRTDPDLQSGRPQSKGRKTRHSARSFRDLPLFFFVPACKHREIIHFE